MRPSGSSKRSSCRIPTRIAALLDPITLHIGDLGEHSDDELAHAPSDGAEAQNVHEHRAQTIDRSNVNRVTLADVGQQRREARTILRIHRARHTLIDKLLFERTAQSLALRFDTLVAGGDTKITNAAHGPSTRSKAPRLSTYKIYAFDSGYFIQALFKVQPIAALDCLLEGEGEEIDDDMFETSMTRTSPLEHVAIDTLVGWADQSPERRYPLIGAAMPLFTTESLDEVTGISETFLTMLRHAPDKAVFMDSLFETIHPSGWAGSAVPHLQKRRDCLARLSEIGALDVDACLVRANGAIDHWIAAERERENAQEERFE
uniref:BTB domain-containing protein n=1 Tax=Globodera pallida TaxID=36090 RepID=A0A183CN40_GLOPA